MSTTVRSWSAPAAPPRTASPASTAVRHLRVDAALGVALLALSVLAALPFPPPPPHGWRGYGLVLGAAALAVAFRRVGARWSHPVFTVGLVLAAALKLPGAGGNTAIIALLSSTYSFAAHAPWARVWTGWPMAVAPIATVMFIRGADAYYVMPIVMIEMGMAYAFGWVQRQRQQIARALDDRALQLDVGPGENEGLAVSEERGRIARDLQGVVTVAIDTMVAAAEEARTLLPRDTDGAGRAADRVASTGRGALQELRRLLSVLRGSSDPAAVATASLEDLQSLIDRAELAGTTVRLEVSGEPASVSEASQRAAYRLVEEALAMVAERDGLRHVDVRIVADEGALRVAATSLGEGREPPGLVAPFDPRVAGLQERVALAGGELRTHLWNDGGFELEARLPRQARTREGLTRPLPTVQQDAAVLEVRNGFRRIAHALLVWFRNHPWAQDLLAAVTLGTASLGEVLLYPEPFYPAERSWRAAVFVYVIAGTLLLRRRFPVGALGAAGVLHVVHDVLMLRWTNVMLLIFSIHVFTVASRRSRSMAMVAVAVAIASHGIFLARVATGAFDTGGLGIPASAALTIVLIVGLRIFGTWTFAAFAGRTLASRERLNLRLVDRIEQLLERRDVQSRLAVAEERRRIARELHDVVGHGLSVMVLQSGAVGSLVRRDRIRAEETLRLIERMGDQAKQELNTLVDLLGPDDREVIGPPGGIEQLVADAREAGLDVSLVVEGDGDPGDRLVVHAYRIVQEALTNASKYAPGTHVSVRLSFLDGAVEVAVVNDAPRAPAVEGNDFVGGHGLIGMRERVSLFGGDLSTGPRPEGGFEIRARLPVPAPA